MGITIDEAIERYKNNAEYERTHGNLQGYLEFRRLAKWLHKYQKIENIVDAYITDNPREPMYDTEDYMQSIREVLEDDK